MKWNQSKYQLSRCITVMSALVIILGVSVEAAPVFATTGSGATTTVVPTNTVKQVRAADIGSGTFGTSAWNITAEGVLHIGAGTFNDTKTVNQMYATCPWQNYASKIKAIVFDGPVKGAANAEILFGGLTALTTITNINYLDTSLTTSMKNMFSGDSSLTSLDLSSWNTSNVTDMKSMFVNDNAMTSLDVSNFNTSKVTDMSDMFAWDEALTTIDVSHFDTSKVTNMSSMFAYNPELTALDVANFDTSNVVQMDSMFDGVAVTALDVANWDTSKVVSMASTFADMSALKTIDLSHWDTTNVTDFSFMFTEDNALETLDISNFKMAADSSVWNMLSDMVALKELTIGKDTLLADTSAQTVELPTLANNDLYTGNWVGKQTGKIASSSDLMNNYDGATMADTYVWQKKVSATSTNSTLIAGPSTIWDPNHNFTIIDSNGIKVNLNAPGVTVEGAVATNKPGSYSVTYKYDDGSSIASTTAIITVVAAQTELTVKPNFSIMTGSSWDNSSAFVGGKDSVGQPIDLSDVTVTGTVNTSKAGNYKLVYSYTDNLGNIVSKTVTVEVVAVDTPVAPSKPVPGIPTSPTNSKPAVKPALKPNQQTVNQNKLPQTGESQSSSLIIIAGIAMVLGSVLGIIGLRRRND